MNSRDFENHKCNCRFPNRNYCPLPATMSDTVKEGSWYCPMHYAEKYYGKDLKETFKQLQLEKRFSKYILDMVIRVYPEIEYERSSLQSERDLIF